MFADVLCLGMFQYDIHHMSSRPEEDAWNQTALPSYDHQEFEEIFHIWSSGKRVITFPLSYKKEKKKEV